MAPKAKSTAKPRRKRRKSVVGRLKWVPILSLALAINTGLGLAYSPILSLRRVRVYGALPTERDRLDKAIQAWANEPLSRVNGRTIEGRVLTLPEVSESHFNHNVFGEGELKLTIRHPVGVVDGTTLVLSDDGALFGWPEPTLPPSLPLVSIPPAALHIGLAIQEGTELGGLVRAAEEVQKQWPDFNGVIELNPVGTLCLNRLEGSRVILGGFDQLEVKVQQLRDYLTAHPISTGSPVEINLVAPDRAVVRPITATRALVSHEPNRQPLYPQGELGHPSQPALHGPGLHAVAGVDNRLQPAVTNRTHERRTASTRSNGND